MEKTEKDLPPKKSGHLSRKYNIREFIERAKTLQGDPHYVAMGMAIGVFISITPTIPFHTVIAVALAFVFKGSKPAAAVGVWFSNPVTVPFFYLGSYKAGMLILGKTAPFDAKYESVFELMKLGLDVTIAMITGGMILGIIPGIAAYFITRKIFATIRARSKFKVDKSKP
ncbi:MAG: hypothetical protein BBJ57_13400 [Desulfobacterales bacterium PC51MH44]|nr:MAG: hypothetical protein BBJ57_13400 [Desulfobacterales bacterium PC51MH44]